MFHLHSEYNATEFVIEPKPEICFPSEMKAKSRAIPMLF